jgi:hypothetical protein
MHCGLTAERRAHSAWRLITGADSQQSAELSMGHRVNTNLSLYALCSLLFASEHFPHHNLEEHTETRSALCAVRRAITIDALD